MNAQLARQTLGNLRVIRALARQRQTEAMEIATLITARGSKVVASFEALTDGPHSFASTQVQLPPTIAKALLDLGASIPEGDLAEDGREADPHVTVLYGLHTDSPIPVQHLLLGEGAVFLTLGPLNYFAAPDYDVIFAEIRSSDLTCLNALLTAHLDVTNSHGDYKPHATVAYVESGIGEQYKGRTDLAGLSATIDHVIFSLPDGEKTAIDLTAEHRDPAGDAGDSFQQDVAAKSDAIAMAHDVNVRAGGSATSGNWGHGGSGKATVIPMPDKEEEFLSSPHDAFNSIANGEHAEVVAGDVRSVLNEAMKSPHGKVNLALLTVEDKPIFAGGLNRARDTMPQIDKEHQEDFLNGLKKQGIGVVRENASPASLRPTQNEIDAKRVGEKLNSAKDLRPIMVSKDDYVLDGHHRWAAMATLDAESPKAGIKEPVIRIMADHEKALGAMLNYTKSHGIVSKALGQATA